MIPLASLAKGKSNSKYFPQSYKNISPNLYRRFIVFLFNFESRPHPTDTPPKCFALPDLFPQKQKEIPEPLGTPIRVRNPSQDPDQAPRPPVSAHDNGKAAF